MKFYQSALTFTTDQLITHPLKPIIHLTISLTAGRWVGTSRSADLLVQFAFQSSFTRLVFQYSISYSNFKIIIILLSKKKYACWCVLFNSTFNSTNNSNSIKYVSTRYFVIMTYGNTLSCLFWKPALNQP